MMNNIFETLIGRISPTLKKISHRLNGHFSFFNDEDLCQEALVYLWVMFQKGELDDKTDSYILQGCYFHLKNYLRTALDKANLISLDTPINGDITFEETLPSENNTAYNTIDTALLRNAIDRQNLTDREKEVLECSMEGLTVREIGERLSISHVAVIKIKDKIRNKCTTLKNHS